MIISTGGLQINEADCVAEPEALVAVTINSVVPVKRTLVTDTVLPSNKKGIFDPFCVTVMLSLTVTLLIRAVTEAMQSSDATGETAGDVMVTTGAGITGHTPRVSPCAACVVQSVIGISIACDWPPPN